MLFTDVATTNRHRSHAQGKRKERLSHRVKCRVYGVLHKPCPIGLQIEGKTFRGTRQSNGAHNKDGNKDKKRNHHPFRDALHALHDSNEANERRKRDDPEHISAAHILICEESREGREEVALRGNVARIVYRVLHEPPRDIRIVDHKDETPRGNKKAHLMPELLCGLWGKCRERLGHAPLSGASVREFRSE